MSQASQLSTGCNIYSRLQALGVDAYALLWLRYSGFLVLYPIGVGSELSMAYLALDQVLQLLHC